MAIIDKKDIKSMGADEIDAKVSELRKEVVKQNAQIATGTTPKSPGKLKETKKTIARLLTEKNNKEKSTK